MTGRVPADDVLNNAVGDNYFSLKSTYFGLPEERLSSGLQGRMEVAFAPALSSMALAQNSVLANQPDQVARCLESVAARIVKCAHVFDAMTPRDTANFDPVVWIKTYPAMGRAVTSGELGNSGVDAPLFHALDVFIGRQQVKGDLRGMQSDRRATLPTNIRAFLDALGDDAGSVRDYVAAARAQLEYVPSEEQAQYKHLSAAWDGLLQLYVWFLERHRVKAVGITGVTLNTGRHSTSSGVKSGDQDKAMKDGKPKMRPEAMLSMQMKKGMVSRLGGRPLWQDAHVQSHSVYRGSVAVAVKLDATLPLEPGDRVQIWPPRKRKTLNRASSHHRRLRGSSCPEDHDTSSGESDDDGEPRFYSIARVIPNVSGTTMDSSLNTRPRGWFPLSSAALRQAHICAFGLGLLPDSASPAT
ncbi:hypothetical protein COL26b_009097 [Colletotrichum chrysophilum]|uniref:uncharacterized protein n=1 Tax=Colletotrichum chrysophilum TaxID=1836956 RepID=UPI0023014221|nr:uncharacterized protein COL26b_009097 [Colletotrichum chrysophilum]KAJ0372753.1 hypothetical protein COL26b_009097 [Colletotrichum chrysophilum]